MHTPAARHWGPIVRRARDSGLSIRAFARQNGFNENTLAWWSWRLGEERVASSFVEVDIEDEEPTDFLHVHVGGVRVDVRADSDLALLRRVVEALS